MEGGDFYFISPGATAPGTPAAEPGQQNAVLAGGLVSWLPDLLAVSIVFCPHPPVPLPGGKGETKVILCKGLRPLHPRGWAGRGTGEGGANHAPGVGRARLVVCLPCFALLSCPHPPVPLPGGKGETKVILCKGLRPLHPRGWAGRGTGEGGANHAPGVGRARLVVCLPCFALLSCPHPPDPLPGGKGETKVILCKGLRPLHPRGWAGRGTGEGGEPRARRGACPLRGGGRGASRCPAEGVPSLPPAYPAFAFFSAPYPPTPFPGGEGGDFRLFYARGFAPCIPGAEPIRRGFDLWKTVSFGYAKDFPFNNIIEKSSGGLGDSFKSPPAFSSHQFRTLLSPLRIPIILSTSWRISGRKRMTREAATTERMRTRRKLRQPEPSFSKRTSAA